MIFPTPSVSTLRGELEDRVSSGEISEAEAYREALAADPDDPRALRLLALLAEDDDDISGATDLAWRWLRADPLSHEVFRLIGRLLSLDLGEITRGVAYLALGMEKLHFDPEAEAEPHSHELTPDGDEPAEVTREMEPHRLLHEMWSGTTSELEREFIDRVLARGADMVPLLTGVLNLYGEDLLHDMDDALVVRSLALLGEIGDPRVVPALTRFLPIEDETLSGVANWAFQRISFRKPAEVLEELNRLIPEAEAFDLASFAQQISLMSVTPGRTDGLLAIERRLPEFPALERGAIALSLLTSAWIMEGLDSPLGAAFQRDYGDQIPAEGRGELKDIRKTLKGEGPYIAKEDETSVYDICCPAFEPAEDDQPYVRNEPKIGRNDPCWCGSGKKYKKCHLEADQNG